jgi:hypothetical protein
VGTSTHHLVCHLVVHKFSNLHVHFHLQIVHFFPTEKAFYVFRVCYQDDSPHSAAFWHTSLLISCLLFCSVESSVKYFCQELQSRRRSLHATFLHAYCGLVVVQVVVLLHVVVEIVVTGVEECSTSSRHLWVWIRVV